MGPIMVGKILPGLHLELPEKRRKMGGPGRWSIVWACSSIHGTLLYILRLAYLLMGNGVYGVGKDICFSV